MPAGDWQDKLTPATQRRFWDKVDTGLEDECWLWTAGTNGKWNDPRGAFWINGGMETSHRVAWVIANGRIPAHLFVLHRCDVGLCCNPKHLFLGTNQVNMADAAAKGRVRGGMPRSFTVEQVLEIRELYKTTSAVKIAAKYNVTHQSIQRIVNRESYKDIKRPEVV